MFGSQTPVTVYLIFHIMSYWDLFSCKFFNLIPYLRHIIRFDTSAGPSILKMPYNKAYWYYWLGITDLEKEGAWRFKSDNAVMSNISYMFNYIGIKWSAGRPLANTYYNCLYWSNFENKFWDGYCSSQYSYYCEHPRMVVSVLPIILPKKIHFRIQILV